MAQSILFIVVIAVASISAKVIVNSRYKKRANKQYIKVAMRDGSHRYSMRWRREVSARKGSYDTIYVDGGELVRLTSGSRSPRVYERLLLNRTVTISVWQYVSSGGKVEVATMDSDFQL